MPSQSEHFRKFIRGIAKRRRVFLIKENSRELIYPVSGTVWEPTNSENSKCDAFIFFTVAELEEYFEGILGDAMTAYRTLFLEYVLRNCSASKDFIEHMNKKQQELSRNNNANWARISHLFEFIGLSRESKFPAAFWDDVDSIVKHRGDVAHNGNSIQISEDRRNIIAKIENTLNRLQIFDRAFHEWTNNMNEEILRVQELQLEFSPNFSNEE
jgi:hypothetical protein